MDLRVNNPNIISYNILNEYIKNKNNYEYFKNLCLTDNNYYFNVINLLNNNNHTHNNNNYDNDYNIENNNQNNYENEHNNNYLNTYYENINDDVYINCEDNNGEDNNDDDNSEDNNSIDAWDSAINDEKFYINNKIARIFPVLKNFNNFSKIKIDEDSFSYITIREIAEIISKIICYHLLEHNLNPQKSLIVDYTSGVGGNVLSFGKFFKTVYAIELDESRAEFLKNNIGVYGFKNINVINECAIEFNDNEMLNINPNVIFVDPPWGGSNYKNNENLTLSLGKIQLEELVIDIVKKFSEKYIKIVNLNPKEKNNNYNNKFIILKLPKNYNIEYFYKYVKSNNNFVNYNICMYLYILNKMIVIVCELQYKFY
jgi:predicted RNA methylase